MKHRLVLIHGWNRRHQRSLIALLFGSLAAISLVYRLQAAIAAFAPPSNLGITMLQLFSDGRPWKDPETGLRHYCTVADTQYGCTAKENNLVWAYPYSSNPAVVSIETDYLLNVAVNETIVQAYHPSAIEAIVAAARSYAYYKTRAGATINNSNESQVFVPFAFESLNDFASLSNPNSRCASVNLNDDQKKVCSAVARRIYVSYPEGSDATAPAFTEYFADIRDRTITNPTAPYSNYLRSVSDPISSHPEISPTPDGHGHGMSQNGASRWAFGTLGFGNNKGYWSTHFLSTDQILTHYYSGVTLRNAAASNTPTAPGARWAPLKITWYDTNSGTAPPLVHGRAYTVTVQVQNTSTLDWSCNYPFQRGIKLRYTWVRANGELAPANTEASLCSVPGGVPRGADINAALRIQDIPNWGGGSYSIRLDVIAYLDASVGCSFTWPLTADNQSGALRFGDDCHWHTYDIKVDVCPDAGCIAHLPLIRKANNSGWPGQ